MDREIHAQERRTVWEGLGPYLAGSASDLLSDYAACIAIHPNPFELLEERKLPENEYARAPD